MKEKVLELIEQSNLSFEARIDAIERLLMIDALEKNNWIKLKAAHELQVTYRIFNYKYDKYNLGSINPRKKRHQTRLEEVSC